MKKKHKTLQLSNHSLKTRKIKNNHDVSDSAAQIENTTKGQGYFIEVDKELVKYTDAQDFTGVFNVMKMDAAASKGEGVYPEKFLQALVSILMQSYLNQINLIHEGFDSFSDINMKLPEEAHDQYMQMIYTSYAYSIKKHFEKLFNKSFPWENIK